MAIRILYLDVSPLDLELVRDTLEIENPDKYRITLAVSGQDFLEKFSQGDFEVVLSDFNIPGLEGLQVLDEVHARDPRLPVIIVTEAGNEEVAVEAMKHGAVDYVIKTPVHIHRLPRTIDAALERKQLQDQRESMVQATTRSEQIFRSFVENSTDGLVMTDEEGIILEWNETMENITQVPRDEALGQQLWEVQFRSVPIENRTAATLQSMKKSFQEILDRGESPFLNRISEADIAWKDGSIRHIQYQIFLMKTDKGFMSGGVARDVTEEKLIEEENLHKTKELTAIVDQNIQLAGEARLQAAQLRLLYDAGLAINTVMEPNTQLELLFNIGMDVLNCDKMEFFRYDPLSNELVLELSNGFKPEHQAKLAAFHFSISAAQGIAGWVGQNRLPLNIPDVKEDPRYIQLDPDIRSGLWAPVVHRDQLLGVLAVFRDGEQIFSSGDERLVTLFASQTAVAMENSHLFAETQKRVRQAQSLRFIDQAISGSLDLSLVLNIVLQELTTELEIDAADILILNPITHFLIFKAGRGFKTPFGQNTKLALGEGNAGRVALEGKMVYIRDLTAAPNSLERSDHYQHENFRTYVGVPLISKGQLKGVLEVFHRSVIQPSNDWLDFLDAIVGQAAIAVDNITMFTDLESRTSELAIAYDATIEGWSRALDLRDQDTEGHSQRVTELTLRLAAGFGFDQDGLVQVQRGALLHDIGKMGIPDSILLKPGPLTPEEWEIMRRHPVYARELILPVHFLHPALDIPYCHHEKWDGTGYPRGLKRTDIPLAARIFAVVDVWDALLSARPYRPSWSREKTLQYIQDQSGKHFDPDVVRNFLNLIAQEI